MSRGAAMDERSPGSGPRTLRVMTYNVRYFGHPTRGLASTGAAFSRIARSLASLDPTPDLVCLQEVEAQSFRTPSINRRWHAEEPELEPVMTELHASLALANKSDGYAASYLPAHTYRL